MRSRIKHGLGRLGLLLFALTVLPLNAALSRQDDEHPRSYYPVLTLSDLQACRPELTALHGDFLQHQRVELQNYSPGGKYADAQNAAYVQRWLTETAAMDPIDWYAKGIEGGEGGPNIGGLDFINGHADSYDEGYRNLAKGLNEWGDPRKGDPPDFDWDNEPYRQPVSDAAQTCIAHIWIAKFDQMHKVVATAPPSKSRPIAAAAPTPLPAPAGAAMSEAAIADCTRLATDKQRESQTWPGDLASRSARLGEYQKELFSGRCAGHPQAAAYIAGAEKMMADGAAAPAPPPGSINYLAAADTPAPTSAPPPAPAEAATRTPYPFPDQNDCLQKVDLEQIFYETSTQVSFRNQCPKILRIQVCYLNPVSGRYICYAAMGGEGTVVSARAPLTEVPDRRLIYIYAACSETSVARAGYGGSCGGNPNQPPNAFTGPR